MNCACACACPCAIPCICELKGISDELTSQRFGKKNSMDVITVVS